MTRKPKPIPEAERPPAVQLPLWGEEKRGLPHAFARSALFNIDSPRKGEDRKTYRNATMRALKGTTILYTGDELRQDDEDVLLQALHFARMQALGDRVRFKARDMLVALRWTLNGESLERLAKSLRRMAACLVEVEVSGRKLTGGSGISLIRRFEWCEPTGKNAAREWVVYFEPEVVGLFGLGDFGSLDWDLRLALKKPLDKWLHAFYHSHRDDPHSLKVETLHELTGSKSDLALFRFNVKKALTRLVAKGFFKRAVVDTKDLVRVQRRVSAMEIQQPAQAALPPPSDVAKKERAKLAELRNGYVAKG